MERVRIVPPNNVVPAVVSVPFVFFVSIPLNKNPSPFSWGGNNDPTSQSSILNCGYGVVVVTTRKNC